MYIRLKEGMEFTMLPMPNFCIATVQTPREISGTGYSRGHLLTNRGHLAYLRVAHHEVVSFPKCPEIHGPFFSAGSLRLRWLRPLFPATAASWCTPGLCG